MAPDKPLTLDLVTFGAGGQRFGLEARCVLGMVPARSDRSAPAAEAALGLPVPAGPGEPRPVLALDGACVEVAPPVALCRIAADAVHPLPPLLAARCRLPALRALALDAGGVILLIDAGFASADADAGATMGDAGSLEETNHPGGGETLPPAC